MLIKNYSSTISGFVIMWIGVGSQSKRRRLSISPASANNECGGSSVAERTRSRRTSFLPHAATPDQPTFVDNLEVLFLFLSEKLSAFSFGFHQPFFCCSLSWGKSVWLHVRAHNQTKFWRVILFLMLMMLFSVGTFLRNNHLQSCCLHYRLMGLLIITNRDLRL